MARVWICLVLTFVSSGFSFPTVSYSGGYSIDNYLGSAVFLFYFIGALGVRQASVAASASMLAAYVLGTVIYFWISPFHFSFLRLIGCALLLTTLRAAILITKWRKDPLLSEDTEYAADRLSLTWRDRIANQMPTKVWPWARFLFYIIAAILIPLECLGVAKLITSHP